MKMIGKIIISTLPLFAIGLIVFQLFLTNELASFGEKILEIDAKIESLSDDNLRLESQVASASSLLTIETKAFELGFKKSSSVIHLDQFDFAFHETR